MTDNEMFDLYRDYLISSFGQTTATGLSALLDGLISHDRIRIVCWHYDHAHECMVKGINFIVDNKIPFHYVLTDGWYAAAEHMRCIKQTVEQDVVTPLKSNRKIALRATDTQQNI